MEKTCYRPSTDILFQPPSNVKWVPYNKFNVGTYDKAYYD